ncbi:MAG: cytochrome P450 [Microthrixaceae bacterium]
MDSNTTAAFDLTDPDTFAAGPPHDIYRHLRDEAPLYWHEPTVNTPDGEGFWCLTRHEDVRWAAKNAELFSSFSGGDREGGGTLIEDLPRGFAAGVLFNMQDDPRHHHMRRVVTPSLSPTRLRQVGELLQGFCDSVLDDAMTKERVDFLVDVAAELPLQALAALLGVEHDDRHFLLEWADATLDYGDRNPGESSQRSQQAGAAMASYCTKVLADKRECPADDLLSLIANSQLPPEALPGGPMTNLEQEMFFHLLAAAGSETTRNTITAGLLALIEHPEQWDALQADRSLMPNAVEEVMRWASSTIYNRRTATTGLQRHGTQIEPGDKVVMWWQAANYDERVFDDPNTFDITRTPNPHLAFGIGTHFCLGANLARLEIALVFNGLLDRAERIDIDGPIERTRSNKHAGFRHVPIRIIPNMTQ